MERPENNQKTNWKIVIIAQGIGLLFFLFIIIYCVTLLLNVYHK